MVLIIITLSLLRIISFRRPPKIRHYNEEHVTKKVLFFNSFFRTGWQFFGLHPEKLAKVKEVLRNPSVRFCSWGGWGVNCWQWIKWGFWTIFVNLGICCLWPLDPSPHHGRKRSYSQLRKSVWIYGLINSSQTNKLTDGSVTSNTLLDVSMSHVCYGGVW